MRFDRKKILTQAIKNKKLLNLAKKNKERSKALPVNYPLSNRTINDLKALSSNSSNLTFEENSDFNFQSGIYFDPNPVGIFLIFVYGFAEFILSIYALYYIFIQYLDFSILQTIFGIHENFLIYHYLASLYHIPYNFFYSICFFLLMIVASFWMWLDDVLDSSEEEEEYTIPNISWFLEGFLMPAFSIFSFVALLIFLASSYHNIILIYGYFLPPLYDQFKNFLFVILTLHQKMNNYVIVFDLKVLNDLLFFN